MTANDRATIAVALGSALLFLAVTGDFRDFVRPSMGPFLLAASAAVLFVGMGGLLAKHTGNAHERHGGNRSRVVAALALLPVLTLVVVTPAPLGSYAALRNRSSRLPIRSVFPALPAPRAGAITLSLADFISRAEYDPGASLRGVRVRLVGRASPAPRSSTVSFVLIRFAIYCCAADAIALRVGVAGASSPPPPADSWVEVTGNWRPAPVRPPGIFDPNAVVILDADGIRLVPQPHDPYDGTL